MVSGKPKPGSSLAEIHPDVARQAFGWDPASVTFKSNQKKSWICNFGHVWDAVVSHRTRGQGCPFCSGRRLLAGFNDLATLHPELAKEADGWDPTDFTSESISKNAWCCSKGHIFEVII